MKQHVDFTGKTVIVAACGYGDLAVHIARHSAPQWVYGTEGDVDTFLEAEARLRAWRRAGVDLHQRVFFDHTAPAAFTSLYPGYHDIGICVAGWGHLEYRQLLAWLRANTSMALIEMTYASSDPHAPLMIQDEASASAWLRGLGWDSVGYLGTISDERDHIRRDLLQCKTQI